MTSSSDRPPQLVIREGAAEDNQATQALVGARVYMFYRPWAQENFPFALIAVRSPLEPEAVTHLVQSALTTVDPGLGQRTGEIGVRMAFGAESHDIPGLVVDQGMRPVAVGLAVGLAAALALGRLMASQLSRTSAHSPLLLTATMAILGFAALLACVVPARRASQVNPVDALRAE